MHGTPRYVALCALIAAALSSVAHSADAIDWRGCIIPDFKADKQAAVVACTAVLQADLTDAERERALLTRGRASHRMNDIDAAIRDFDAAIMLAPQDPEPLVRRASAAFFKKEYRAASELAERALRLNGRYAEAYDILGTVAQVAHNYRLAKIEYDREIELDPRSVAARFHRFEVFMKTGAEREGMRELDDLLAMNSPALDTEFQEFRGAEVSYRTLVRLERATMFEAMGRYEDSIKALNDLVRTDPGAVSYGWRGWYYHNRDQFDLALADLEKALSYDPHLAILYNLKGQVYLYTKDYERAVAAFTRSIELRIDPPGSSYWSRALALRALHRTDEALKDAQTAVSVDCCFLFDKSKTLIKLGYLQPVTANSDVASAVRDAVHACMLDEQCW